MRYFALTNGPSTDPVGLVRFDPKTVTASYFSAQAQDWVVDGDLIGEVVMQREDSYEVDEAEANRIQTGVLATPVT